MKNQSPQKNMLPKGTEVYYNGMYGTVRFACEYYMTVCMRKFPQEPSRDVCILVYPNQQHLIELVNGNHSHER
jgi:hypothetical protein